MRSIIPAIIALTSWSLILLKGGVQSSVVENEHSHDIDTVVACPEFRNKFTELVVNTPVPGLSVLCDYSIDGQGWIVIHRRFNGRLSFNRNWTDYREGFGSLRQEFWLGLENVHRIIRNGGQYDMLVVLQSFFGDTKMAMYHQFKVDTEMERYKMTYGQYLGGTLADSLRVSNGRNFSTPNRDKDKNCEFRCADEYSSGWWFQSCFDANLNGLYKRYKRRNTMSWYGYYNDHECLKSARMMIRADGFAKVLENSDYSGASTNIYNRLFK